MTYLVIGAGARGRGYATFTTKPEHGAQVVGLAEPRDWYREDTARTYSVPAENVFKDWQAAAARPRFADVAIISTQDALHVEPMLAFAEKGYNILLEKPMAPDAEGCRRIVKKALEKGILFAVGHVMRYTDYTRQLNQIVDAGTIGDVVSIEHMEPVGYWHQAHSYVRGNWRREDESSSMLLAKSCHDIDWLRHLMGKPCRKVSSFGSLKHFRKEEKPAGAGERCVACGIEPTCPYSAKKIYLGRLAGGHTGWPVNVLAPEVTTETITEALRTGPYGRCVYSCDNDVVDHQVVILEYEGGRTASFTMTAFTAHGGRKTRIFGTRGMIEGDGSVIKILDFLTDQCQTVDTRAPDAGLLGGHGGGDYWLMRYFTDAVRHNDPSRILSGPQEALETHLTVFAAERARREGRVVEMQP